VQKWLNAIWGEDLKDFHTQTHTHGILTSRVVPRSMREARLKST